MTGFGERLRQEREAREITLRQIADETKISLRYLQALEADDLKSLPGTVFNKGYVRTYAEFIGVDPNPLVAAYVAEEKVQSEAGRLEEADLLNELSRSIDSRVQAANGHRGNRFVPIALGLGGALVLVLAATWWFFLRPEPAPGGAEATLNAVVPPAIREVAQQEAPSSEVPHARPVEAQPQPDAAPPERSPEAVADAREPEPVPREDPAPPVAVAAAAPAGGASIPEYGIGTAVVNRQLVGRDVRFESGSQVWFWTRVIGAEAGETIRHVWIHDGKEILSTPLKIGGPHWRTQSRKTLIEGAGAWSVEARDASGRVLARESFTCLPRG